MSALYVAKATRVAARALDGEMMIMSAQDSTFFTLNPIGTIIWESADGKTPLEEIVERKVCAEFDVEPGEALKDTETFVRQLAERGIMVVSETPVTNG